MPRSTEPAHLPISSAQIDELVFLIFRANGQLLQAGDRLVGSLGLTSARWQILGSIATADRPRPVVWLARDIGVTRQNVQRIVNDLERDGIVAFRPNPEHKRAQLVTLTERGRLLFDKSIVLQQPWAAEMGRGLTQHQLAVTKQTLEAILHRLSAPIPDRDIAPQRPGSQ